MLQIAFWSSGVYYSISLEREAACVRVAMLADDFTGGDFVASGTATAEELSACAELVRSGAVGRVRVSDGRRSFVRGGDPSSIETIQIPLPDTDEKRDELLAAFDAVRLA